LYDRDGNLVPTDGEAREAAEELARIAQQRAETAEAELARLREELARQKGDG
jgi:hypothetical protein